MINLIVDVFSGDNPDELVRGAAEAINKFADIKLTMTGNQEYLKAELAKYNFDRTRLEIIPTTQIIDNNDAPTTAIRQKKDSSLVRGMELLKSDGYDGMISAGSTGAILCCGIFIVGRLRGIDRPALCPVLPTEDGGNVCIIDCGANADCRSEYLAQFALLGSCIMRSVCKIKNPRVAIVNVGTEEHKGNQLTIETAKLIEQLPLNFVGNMEARDALSGKYDVLVCDGFVGNVLLKSIEGTAQLFARRLETVYMQNNPSADLPQLRGAIDEVMTTLDYNGRGGAYLVGCKKTIMKIHGAATFETLPHAVGLVRSCIKNGMVESVAQLLEKCDKMVES